MDNIVLKGYFIAVYAFLTTIYSSLMIYQLNSKHLEDVLKGSSESDPNLEKYDKISIRAFILGAFFALFIGAISAYQKIILKENNMTNEELINKNVTLNPKIIQQPKIKISKPSEQNAANNDTNTSDSK